MGKSTSNPLSHIPQSAYETVGRTSKAHVMAHILTEAGYAPEKIFDLDVDGWVVATAAVARQRRETGVAEGQPHVPSNETVEATAVIMARQAQGPCPFCLDRA
jgi:hypothetical protein